ncbi:MAG TPA: hypothetical protein VK558_10435 [Patescibacteria group bacterium]|nr:hypothetical protein [Patescibacteria group bacterium]
MAADSNHWNELERRYDGPIPEEDQDRARWGLDRPDPLDRAAGLRLMWASHTRRHIRCIRKARQIAGAHNHVAALMRELTVLLLYSRGANRAYWHLRRQGAKDQRIDALVT